jgi:hypothetical protein
MPKLNIGRPNSFRLLRRLLEDRKADDGSNQRKEAQYRKGYKGVFDAVRAVHRCPSGKLAQTRRANRRATCRFLFQIGRAGATDPQIVTFFGTTADHFRLRKSCRAHDKGLRRLCLFRQHQKSAAPADALKLMQLLG